MPPQSRRHANQTPKYHELMWPTLKAIEALDGSASIQEIAEKVIEAQGFSEEQQRVLHGDGPETELAYRLAWARTYLKYVGALDNSTRGIWSITEKGRSLTEADMATIPPKVRALTAKKGSRSRRARSLDGTMAEVDDGDAESGWKELLLSTLLEIAPDRFERLAQRLLREADFIRVTVTGRSGDGGIDGIGVYRLSLVSFPVFFQCKRYRGSVGAGAVRDFRGAMAGRGDKGLLITTGTFTTDAKHEATRDGAPPIDLIDGDQLCDLLRRYSLGVVTRQVEKVEIIPDFFGNL